MFFISGVNIDISPAEGNARVPMLNFIPWAAVHLQADGAHKVFEQAQLVDMLMRVSSRNKDAICLEEACSDDRVKINFIVSDGANQREV